MGRPCDDRLMWEAYQRGDKTEQELIDEGLWDRLKARGAGLAKGAGQVGKNIGAVAKAGVQGIAGKGDAAIETLKGVKSPGTSGVDAKSMQLINSHIAKIEKALFDFQNDVKKMKLEEVIQQASPEAQGAFNAISGALKNLQTRLKPEGQAGSAAAKTGQYKGGSKFEPIKTGKLSGARTTGAPGFGGYAQQRQKAPAAPPPVPTA